MKWPGGKSSVSQIACEFEIAGAWFAQTVELAATEGTYDWIRKRMRLAPGAERRQLEVADFNAYAGTWIKRPENLEHWNAKFLPQEVEMKFIMLQNLLNMDEPANLEAHVLQEDLDLTIKDLPADLLDSMPGFSMNPAPASKRPGRRFT